MGMTYFLTKELRNLVEVVQGAWMYSQEAQFFVPVRVIIGIKTCEYAQKV